MTALLVLLCQGDATGGVRHDVKGEFLLVWTQFDEEVRVEDGPGVGLNGRVDFNYGNPVSLVLRFGVMGWETENDKSETGNDSDVHVRHYRAGAGIDIRLKERIHLGASLNTGFIRFQGGNERESTPSLELQVTLGVDVVDGVTGCVLAMETVVFGNSFNRGSGHTFDNFTLGGGLEIRF